MWFDGALITLAQRGPLGSETRVLALLCHLALWPTFAHPWNCMFSRPFSALHLCFCEQQRHTGGKKRELGASRVQQGKTKKRFAFPRNYGEEASEVGAAVHRGTRVGRAVTSRTGRRGRPTREGVRLEVERLLEKRNNWTELLLKRSEDSGGGSVVTRIPAKGQKQGPQVTEGSGRPLRRQVGNSAQFSTSSAQPEGDLSPLLV